MEKAAEARMITQGTQRNAEENRKKAGYTAFMCGIVAVFSPKRTAVDQILMLILSACILQKRFHLAA